MDPTASFAISAAGMTVERTRVETAAMNLANANTVQEAGAAPYRPLRVVARAAAAPFAALVEGGLQPLLPVATLEPVSAGARMVYEPGHPMANDKGFVAYAGVDPATEMVTLMSAMRSYEANVAAMNTARTLALKALDIGGAA